MTPKNRTLLGLSLVIICCSVMVIDSVIVRIYANLQKEPPISISLQIFAGFIVFAGVSNFLLIRMITRRYLKSETSAGTLSKFSYRAVLLSQFILMGLLGSITFELAVSGQYHQFLLSIILYLSFTTGAVYLSLIAFQFFLWLRVRLSYPIVLYGVAFSLISMNVILAIPYLLIQLSYVRQIIQLNPIKAAIFEQFQSSSETSFILGTFYDYSSAIAFVLLWLSTAIQLKTYSSKTGKKSYWMIMAAPILFYLIPIIADELNIFDILRLEYGSQFNLIYTIVFGPYRQVAGILFGSIFWITALSLKPGSLRNTFQMAGTGMVLLLGSTALHGITYFVAPPFGIVTITFVGIAAYMLSIGIVSSTRILAGNALFYKELVLIRHEKNGLLSNISRAELEKKLVGRLKSILDRTKTFEIGGPDANSSDEEIKQYVEDALREVDSIRGSEKDSQDT